MAETLIGVALIVLGLVGVFWYLSMNASYVVEVEQPTANNEVRFLRFVIGDSLVPGVRYDRPETLLANNGYDPFAVWTQASVVKAQLLVVGSFLLTFVTLSCGLAVLALRPAKGAESAEGDDGEEAASIGDRDAQRIGVASESAGPVEPYDVVRIFYGTDRAPTGNTEPNSFYGGERSRDGLLYGTCEVSLPRRHEVGEIERPRWWKLEFREDPERHVVLARVLPEPRDRFFGLMRNRVRESTRREAFVFIHGFNVSFSEAAWRTGQIAYDLKFEGAPILYSWPSQGGALEYKVDETNVRWTESHFGHFLEDVVAESGAENLYLIAHSMGNRALTEVLKDLAARIGEGKKPAFTEIFLTAPDIDADTFREEIAPKIRPAADHLTLYASNNDRALKVSKGINGYPRAGDAGDGLVVVDGIDTIDASEVSTDFLGHSYFDSVVPDIGLLIRKGLSPADRGLVRAVRGRLRYWVMVPPSEQGADSMLR